MATKMVLQIAKGAEGGLSEIEKRALRDLAEQVDAKQIYIINRDGPVAMEEVMEVLK